VSRRYYLYRCERTWQETFSSLHSEHPSTLINNPNLCSSPNVRYQVSRPYIVLRIGHQAGRQKVQNERSIYHTARKALQMFLQLVSSQANVSTERHIFITTKVARLCITHWTSILVNDWRDPTDKTRCCQFQHPGSVYGFVFILSARLSVGMWTIPDVNSRAICELVPQCSENSHNLPQNEFSTQSSPQFLH